MKSFYLSKNQDGYYRVYFVDPVTGARSVGKSTHTKDRDEAILIAGQWRKDGAPSVRSGSRAFLSGASETCRVDIQTYISTLSDSELRLALSLISQKLNVVASSVVPEASVPVQTPVKKPYIVHKKAVLTAGASSVPGVPASVPAGDGKHKIYETMKDFWDYDNSEFIKRHLAHGFSMTRKHTIQMMGFVKNNWLPYFGEDKCIEDLTRNELDDFFFYLFDDKGFSGETVNKNINCANRCFSWLKDKGELKTNPLEGIQRFKIDSEERGIPTKSEIRSLLELEWENAACKLAFKVSAFYGLRAGEISGLRVCDIDAEDDMIHVRHSWSEVDKLKSTKNSDIREIPVEHSLILELLTLAKSNPLYGELSYVFYSSRKNEEPITPGYYGDVFYNALEAIGVSEAERKDRNIVFHSLRHFCCTILKQQADNKTVMAIMGHRSLKMTEHYSDHDTREKLNNMRNVISGVWERYMSA